MRKTLTVFMVVAILVLSAAVALADVSITTPEADAEVGPSTTVEGTASEKAFLVVYTEVYDNETGDYIRKVPGIRHWTKEDNSYSVRIATPRLLGQLDHSLKYVIKVKAYSDPQLSTGDPDLGEASVTVYSK